MGLSRCIATYLVILWVALPAAVSGQQPDTLRSDTLQIETARGDTLRTDSLRSDTLQIDPARSDTLRNDTLRSDTLRSDSLAVAQADTAGPAIEIIPWVYRTGLDSEPVSNDSLLRWQIWPAWMHKKNRDPGVITYRLGTAGRNSAMMTGAHEPRHQELYWEDIRLDDPVSGSVNWNMLPLHKLNAVYEDGAGIDHETNFTLKQYYVNKPLTKLIFDESKFERRALEFWLTQNFSRKTNAEISYWDRRGGGGYANSQYRGSQIFARVYHQLDNRQFFKLRFLTGNNTLGEPFGYIVPDPKTFTFNWFSATPVESSAESRTGFSTLSLSYHRRAQDTVAVPENLRTGIFLNSRKRAVDYSADSTYYKVQSAGVFLHKWFQLDPVKLEGRASYERFFNRDISRSSIPTGGWDLLSAKGTAVFSPIDWWRLKGEASVDYRDGSLGNSLGVGTELDLFNRVTISAGASRGTILPTPQQLYWSSANYSGNENLQEERIEEVHGSLEIQIARYLRAGVKGQFKLIENGIFVGTDSSFTNVGQYNTLSSTGYVDYSGRHFEISASATMQRYQDYVPAPGAITIPDFRNERIWLKGSAYWKGYLFDRATYVKGGVAGMFSPQPYLADHYNPVLDYWQPASLDQQVPWFSRLDVELSARVRTIMFLVRYENVLDRISQVGYFETAGYPMPPRRFIFGVRAIFNN